MALITAQVYTDWGVDPDGYNTASVYLKYLPIAQANGEYFRVTDMTEQPNINIPTSPNLFIVRVITGPVTFAEIQLDPEYLVAWYE